MHLLDIDIFSRFRGQRDVKVLRHSDSKRDLWALRAASRPLQVNGHDLSPEQDEYQSFDYYQSTQAWDVFGAARFMISFIAERQKYAKFVGVWEVEAKKSNGPRFTYATREITGFESLEGRLVVQWGAGTRSWAQWLHSQGNKEVSEILPPNYVMDFPGFYDFTLSFDQLGKMVKNPEANREWHRMLSSVSGVYLVLDEETGMQYVGSAYGAGGIWARWTSYAKNPTGGNVRLKELLLEHPNRHERFQFSILRVLEPGITKEAVINHEVWAKRKLGCRAFGLNCN